VPASSSSFVGTARLISPHDSAVRASIASPVMAISERSLSSIERPTATMGVVQKRPPFPPGVQKVASCEATAKSAVATNWQPPPVARP